MTDQEAWDLVIDRMKDVPGGLLSGWRPIALLLLPIRNGAVDLHACPASIWIEGLSPAAQHAVAMRLAKYLQDQLLAIELEVPQEAPEAGPVGADGAAGVLGDAAMIIEREGCCCGCWTYTRLFLVAPDRYRCAECAKREAYA